MIIGIIPARLKSARLNNKPLQIIDNLTVIEHTFLRAKLCKVLDKVVVCTDSKIIFNKIKKLGGECFLSKKKHRNGTERINEYSAKNKNKYKLVIDIQCDEVFLNPKHIEELVNYHKKNYTYDIIIPHSIISDGNDISKCKIVTDSTNKKIIYMSRYAVPFYENKKYKKHLDTISFKPNSLKKYSLQNATEIEKLESIECLRAIDMGLNVGTLKIDTKQFSINTPRDLKLARKIMKNDKIRKLY